MPVLRPILLMPYVGLRLGILFVATTAVSGCFINGPSGPLFRTEFRADGTVSSSRDGAVVSGAVVDLRMDTRDGLIIVATGVTDAGGRYVVAHTLNLGPDRCASLWVASSAPGYSATAVNEPRYRLTCGVGTQSINISLSPVS
jgi:hypothetical protein